jgi:hypothetical protein
MRSPNTPRVESLPAAEQARRVHEECILELQKQPATGLRVLEDVALADATETPIAHKLGRKPLWVQASCVRGALNAGRIEEVRSGSYDRTRVVVLKATGFGATVTVEVVVL